MIKNILFDMGNVLIRYDPDLFIARLGLDEADAALLRREVFGGVDWAGLDRGTLTEREAQMRICARVPQRLHAAVETLLFHWDEPPEQIEGMEGLVAELSEKGYGLCLLSNASLRHHEYFQRYPVSRFFGDRIMLSSDWLLLKPDPAFYQKAMGLLALERSECLFIDDNAYNVESAIRFGLDGLVFFGDAALLRRQLREKGVDVAL